MNWCRYLCLAQKFNFNFEYFSRMSGEMNTKFILMIDRYAQIPNRKNEKKN